MQRSQLFVLLHLKYFDSTNNSYINEIKKYHKGYDKWYSSEKIEIHRKIIQGGISNLNKNISSLEKIHWDKIHIKDKNPFSEVHEIYKNFE